MSPTAIGLVGMAALLALLFLRMPIGIAMSLVGAVGIAVLNSPTRRSSRWAPIPTRTPRCIR